MFVVFKVFFDKTKLSCMQTIAIWRLFGRLLSTFSSNSPLNRFFIISCLKQTLVVDVSVIEIKPLFKGLILNLEVSTNLDNILHPV